MSNASLLNSPVYTHASSMSFPGSVPAELVSFRQLSQSLGFQLGQLLKRVIDISGALFGLALFAPIMLAVALAVKLSSKGPILYKSLRFGKDKTPFYMYKFRTMGVNAESQREALRRGHQQTGLFKIERDPRVTPLGEFLRKYSLDELPQFLNVLKGDMSLVGPRPFVKDETDLFQYPYTLRFEVLPGITGPWQAGGRSNIDFHGLCNLELDYVLRWSVITDLKLLFITVPQVLLKRGAY
jgi:lipopolysaccharide/colanic/teichoic acid biosynthesis glycosyltransferase